MESETETEIQTKFKSRSVSILKSDLEKQGDERKSKKKEESSSNECGQKVDRDVAVREKLLCSLQSLLLHYFILRKLKKRS